MTVTYGEGQNALLALSSKAFFIAYRARPTQYLRKATMHAVVAETMAGVRRDRPVHLLGIGGISDIFHGVSTGYEVCMLEVMDP